MQTEYSRLAISDLEAIQDYIAQDSPVNADKFIEKILDRCDDILSAPEGYLARSEIMDGLRSVAFKDYMIFYTFEVEVVRIERILHGSRDYLKGEFE